MLTIKKFDKPPN